MSVRENADPGSTRYVGAQLRLYPNRWQDGYFRCCLDAQRELWNDMLKASRDHQRRTGRYFDHRQLEQFVKAWKAETPGALELPGTALYRVAGDMGRAFSGWRRMRREGHRAGHYPRLRSRYGRQTGIYQLNREIRLQPGRVRMLKVGWMRWRGGDLPLGKLMSGRVWLDAGGRWMLSLVYECAMPRTAPATMPKVGIALGGPALATLHDGTTFSTVAETGTSDQTLRRLRRLDKLMGRTETRCGVCGHRMERREWQRLGEQGKRNAPCGHPLPVYVESKRYHRLKERRAIIWRKERLRRRDHVHKATTPIVKKAGEIVAGRVAADGPTVADSSGEFLRQLGYKAVWHRRRFVDVTRDEELEARCAKCGENDENGGQLVWRCRHCGEAVAANENLAVSLYQYEGEGADATGMG